MIDLLNFGLKLRESQIQSLAELLKVRPEDISERLKQFDSKDYSEFWADTFISHIALSCTKDTIVRLPETNWQAVIVLFILRGWTKRNWLRFLVFDWEQARIYDLNKILAGVDKKRLTNVRRFETRRLIDMTPFGLSWDRKRSVFNWLRGVTNRFCRPEYPKVRKHNSHVPLAFPNEVAEYYSNCGVEERHWYDRFIYISGQQDQEFVLTFFALLEDLGEEPQILYPLGENTYSCFRPGEFVNSGWRAEINLRYDQTRKKLVESLVDQGIVAGIRENGFIYIEINGKEYNLHLSSGKGGGAEGG